MIHSWIFIRLFWFFFNSFRSLDMSSSIDFIPFALVSRQFFIFKLLLEFGEFSFVALEIFWFDFPVWGRIFLGSGGKIVFFLEFFKFPVFSRIFYEILLHFLSPQYLWWPTLESYKINKKKWNVLLFYEPTLATLILNFI